MKKICTTFLLLLLSLTGFSQFQKEELTFSGTGDLTMALGKFKIGTEIRIEAYVAGGWAEVGGVYQITGNWNENPKIIYRGGTALPEKLKLYGYVSGSAYAYLFATWDNTSPSESNKERNRIIEIK